MTELAKKLPDLKEFQKDDPINEKDELHDLEIIKGAALRGIRLLLNEKDPQHDWGGLQKVLTAEGHYLYLFEHHAKQYNI